MIGGGVNNILASMLRSNGNGDTSILAVFVYPSVVETLAKAFFLYHGR